MLAYRLMRLIETHSDALAADCSTVGHGARLEFGHVRLRPKNSTNLG